LRRLEDKYHDVLAVIGVHSAKFMAERSEAGLRHAVRRHEIRHPVVNDADFRVWSQYAVRAWPTLYFVSPGGKIVFKHEGELDFESFDRVLSMMVDEYDSLGLLDRRPLHNEREESPEGILSYPGKVLADATTDTLFIADTNHNRILETSLDGRIRREWGDGEAGIVDGDQRSARFNHPQGMALHGGNLYVADTENHAVRALRLEGGVVETIAGTGDQAHSYAPSGAPGKHAALSSPWDVCVVYDVLYIAMAGTHQIWSLELSSGLVRPFAGSGREGIEDGPISQAGLAQTSGLTTDGARLYFADSETSAIRWVDVASGLVQTIVGLGLFEFGDEDGVGDAVRLQHPLDVECHEGALYFADTYNNKIKKLDPTSRASHTWLGSGERGLMDGLNVSASFNEPSGLSAADGTLYIADANNHAIRAADLETGVVSTIEITEL